MKKSVRPLLPNQERAFALLFWLAVWQIAALVIGQKILLVTPLEALRCFLAMLPQPAFWARVIFSTLRILAGFGLAVLGAFLLAALARSHRILAALIELPLQAIKATPVASFIILALLWVSSRQLSVLISFFMALPILYSAVQTGLDAADPALLEMAQVFRMALCARIRAIWLPGLYFRQCRKYRCGGLIKRERGPWRSPFTRSPACLLQAHLLFLTYQKALCHGS